jgi:superoxide dismutase, Fe-Mn family
MAYKEQAFNLPDIPGISAKQIEVHLGLYAGYVKHVNLIDELIADMAHDEEKNAYAIAEMRRRHGFEFNGMRNHEYYFGHLEHGAQGPDPESALQKALAAQYGSFDAWLAEFKKIAGGMRGSGWTMLHHDQKTGNLMNVWITDHELGQHTSLQPVIALDMWEHAYMVDYVPAEKKQYIDAYLAALNWGTVEAQFDTQNGS